MKWYKNIQSISKIPFTLLFIILLHSFVSGQKSDTLSKNQRTPHKFFKIGLEGGIIYTDPKDVNTSIESWVNSIGSSTRGKLYQDIHIGLVANGYIALTPVKFLDIRPEFEYSYIPKSFKFDYGSKALDIGISSYSPGISVNFLLGVWRLGGGFFNYYCNIKWEDFQNDYSDTWKGDNFGYQVYGGINPKTKSNVGMSINFVYRNIVIEELRNSNNQVVMEEGEDRNFKLDLSGFEFRLGLYYKFLRVWR